MQEFLIGLGIVLLYFIILASLALLGRFMLRIPDEIFRKILHCILLGSLLPFVFAFDRWWISAICCVAFAVIVYPILVLFERRPSFSEVTTERKHGELKSSLLLVFSMFAVVISICWGIFKDPYLVLAAIYAWGIGDAAAALIGKKFGKHKIHWKYVDGKKSFEGSTAMFVASFLTVAVILMIRGALPAIGYIIIPAVTAAASALSELYSKNGMDTIFCPLSAMAVLLPLMYLFGGLV